MSAGKRAVEALCRRTGLAALVRRLRDPTTAVLAYHNVVPEGETGVGDLSLHIPQRRFAEHLERILESHRVVPLDEALAPRGEDDDGRPRVAVTFDDAYVGALTAGLEELARRRLPATIFVPPGLLGAEGFWWDLLAGPAEGLAEAVREVALWRCAGRPEEVLAWAQGEGLKRATLPDFARPADEAAVVEAGRRPGVWLGSHTWSHPNLAAVDVGEARREVERAHRWLREREVARTGRLAYPYGLCSEAAEREAAGVVDGALLVTGGLAEVGGRLRGGSMRVPRINVPAGLTPDGLGLRLAGLLT